jgi:hypothetical protein
MYALLLHKLSTYPDWINQMLVNRIICMYSSTNQRCFNETIRAVCTVVTRDLMPDERAQFGISEQGPTCPVH